LDEVAFWQHNAGGLFTVSHARSMTAKSHCSFILLTSSVHYELETVPPSLQADFDVKHFKQTGFIYGSPPHKTTDHFMWPEKDMRGYPALVFAQSSIRTWEPCKVSKDGKANIPLASTGYLAKKKQKTTAGPEYEEVIVIDPAAVDDRMTPKRGRGGDGVAAAIDEEDERLSDKPLAAQSDPAEEPAAVVQPAAKRGRLDKADPPDALPPPPGGNL
jgi:hypothetical protein